MCRTPPRLESELLQRAPFSRAEGERARARAPPPGPAPFSRAHTVMMVVYWLVYCICTADNQNGARRSAPRIPPFSALALVASASAASTAFFPTARPTRLASNQYHPHGITIDGSPSSRARCCAAARGARPRGGRLAVALGQARRGARGGGGGAPGGGWGGGGEGSATEGPWGGAGSAAVARRARGGAALVGARARAAGGRAAVAGSRQQGWSVWKGGGAGAEVPREGGWGGHAEAAGRRRGVA